MKLLIVEDDEDIRKELALFFKEEFEVLEAAELAAARLHTDADIVLLDLSIGKDTSFSLIQEFSGACIVISVRNDEASIIRALDMGAYDYVTKPFSLSILQARVHASAAAENGGGVPHCSATG
ncbi:MAG: response regulator transcription factor [Treponema sp.]